MITIETLVGSLRARDPLEVLYLGRWCSALMTRATCGGTFGGQRFGHVTLRVYDQPSARGLTPGTELEIQAAEIPMRVRFPLAGRTLAPDEIDRYIAETSTQVAIDKDMLDALARTAKAVGTYPDELAKLRAQVKSLQDDRDNYKKQALDRAEVLAEIGRELSATGFAARDTPYTETIQKIDAARKSAVAVKDAAVVEQAKFVRDAAGRIDELVGSVNHQADAIKKLTQERDHARALLDSEVKGRNKFARDVAVAIGMMTLKPERHPNWPSEIDVVRNARERCFRPPAFLWRSASEYQREIDELRAALQRTLEQRDKFELSLIECRKKNVEIDVEASKHAIRRKEAEDALGLAKETVKSLAESNTRLRGETSNWRKSIPVEVFADLQFVHEGMLGHSTHVNAAWRDILARWRVKLDAANKLLRGDA